MPEPIYTPVNSDDTPRQEQHFHDNERAIKAALGLHAAVSGLFALVAIVSMSFSFDHCNALLNGFFVVAAFDSMWACINGLVSLLMKRYKPLTLGALHVKVWIAALFTLFAFADGKYCDPALVSTARALSTIWMGYNMFLYSAHEFYV